MKKIIFSLIAMTALNSFAFALSTVVNPDSPAVKFKEVPSINDGILQQWFKNNHIKGKKINNNLEAKKLNNFPEIFNSFNIRVIKHNSVVTMDFSAQRINFTLDEENNIVQVFIG